MQLDDEMKSEQFEPLKSCDLKLPSIPQRSRLYQLEPIGIGTPLVESLTGYVTRLAEAHCVPTGILMSRELASLVDKIYVKRGASKGLSELFLRAGALNGSGSMAMDLVQALESLTFCTNLRFLTLLSWAEILPTRGLFRTHKAWCLTCYKEWLLAGQGIVDPLIWMIDAVKVCPQHHRPLSFHCLNCNQQLPLLTWHSRPGFCSTCGKWLGIISEEELSNQKRLSTDELNWQIWIVNSVGELLAAAPRLSSLPSKESIARSLHAVVNLVSEGNIAAFARLLEMPKNTVWMWYAGKVLPQLSVLLKICYRLGISVLDFLTDEICNDKLCRIDTQKTLLGVKTTRASPRLFDSIYVMNGLLAVLESEETPPPTVKEVAFRLGYDTRLLYRHFPELCKNISAKYRSYQKEDQTKRINQFCLEVQRITFKLYQDGVYPSEAQVTKQIVKPGYLRYQKVRAALREARRELGLEK